MYKNDYKMKNKIRKPAHKRKKKRNTIIDSLKIAKRNSRNEEITLHGKPINYLKIVKSKKVYSRKKVNKRNLQDN